MQRQFLKVCQLILLQIIIVGNLQVLPANASYGLFLPFLYTIAVICFFLPCIFMVSKLATLYPLTGGAYVWCEQAFGQKFGFFTVCILWIANLLWYPSIFSLIAANFAYLFNPDLANNQLFVLSFGIFVFWLLTGLNIMGVKFSSKISVVCSVIGIIFPMLLIIIGGTLWYLSGKPLAVTMNVAAFFPPLSHINVGFLIAVVISLFGLELTAVHAGNVVDPKRNYPLSLWLSGGIVLLLLLFSQMAMAVIIPADKLSVITGLLDALIIFLNEMHWHAVIIPILVLVLVGNIGSVSAWMLGSTRGMYVACQKNHVAKFLQKLNKVESPIGVLLAEAVIFTLVSMVFLIFPRVVDSFWFLLVLASQVTLIYYIILFLSAIRLKQRSNFKTMSTSLNVAAPKWFIIMSVGAITSAIALGVGFVAPDGFNKSQTDLFHSMMVVGLVITMLVPVLLLLPKIKKYK